MNNNSVESMTPTEYHWLLTQRLTNRILSYFSDWSISVHGSSSHVVLFTKNVRINLSYSLMKKSTHITIHTGSGKFVSSVSSESPSAYGIQFDEDCAMEFIINAIALEGL